MIIQVPLIKLFLNEEIKEFALKEFFINKYLPTIKRKRSIDRQCLSNLGKLIIIR